MHTLCPSDIILSIPFGECDRYSMARNLAIAIPGADPGILKGGGGGGGGSSGIFFKKRGGGGVQWNFLQKKGGGGGGVKPLTRGNLYWK